MTTQKRGFLRPTLAAMAVAQLMTNQANAATFTVTSIADNGAGTLREALEFANAAADLDEIDFSVAAPAQINLSSGELVVINPVTITGLGQTNLTINAGDNHRAIYVDSSTLTLNSLTISNGSASTTGSGYDTNGGGIFVKSGVLELNNCTVTGSTATNGGGVSARGSTITLNNSVISDNEAFRVGYQPRGGGISGAFSSLTINNSDISGNSAISGQGGGIYTALDSVTIFNVSLSMNYAGLGSAIRSTATELTIQESTLSENTGGGALSAGFAGANRGSLLLTNSTISNNDTSGISAFGTDIEVRDSSIIGNSAGGVIGNVANAIIYNSIFSGNTSPYSGGALTFNNVGSLTLYASSIYENYATQIGGGVHLANNASATIVNSTISSNSAGLGGGGIFAGNTTLNLDHSLLAFNQAGINSDGGGLYINNVTANVTSSMITGNAAAQYAEIRERNSVAFNSYGINLFGNDSLDSDAAFGNFTPAVTDLNATSDGLNATPLTKILNSRISDNGGATPTHALSENSVAVDAGDNALCRPLDQRGIPRPASMEDACDIGPFEQTAADRAKFGNFFVVPLENGKAVIFEF